MSDRTISFLCWDENLRYPDGTVLFEFQSNGDLVVRTYHYLPDKNNPGESEVHHNTVTLRKVDVFPEGTRGINQPRELADWMRMVVK